MRGAEALASAALRSKSGEFAGVETGEGGSRGGAAAGWLAARPENRREQHEEAGKVTREVHERRGWLENRMMGNERNRDFTPPALRASC